MTQNPFTMIPDQVRKYLYIAFAAGAAFLGVCNIVEVESILSVTVDKWNEVLAYLSLVFGVTAASNVQVAPKTPDETGAIDGNWLIIALIVMVLFILLIVAGIINVKV